MHLVSMIRQVVKLVRLPPSSVTSMPKLDTLLVSYNMPQTSIPPLDPAINQHSPTWPCDSINNKYKWDHHLECNHSTLLRIPQTTEPVLTHFTIHLVLLPEVTIASIPADIALGSISMPEDYLPDTFPTESVSFKVNDITLYTFIQNHKKCCVNYN